MCVCVCARVRACVCTLSHVRALCDPIDWSPLGSSVPEIFQARILEWGAISYSKGIFLTQGLNLRLLCFLHWQVGSLPAEPPGKPQVLS